MAYIGIDAKKDIRLNATSDLDLTSDSTTIKFGADDDVILTHVHNTGLLLNSTNQFQFGDSGTYIHQSADGVLDLVSDTEIEINATTIDINGNVDISGTTTASGAVAFNGASVLGQSSLAEAALNYDSGTNYGLEIKDVGSGTVGTSQIFYRGSNAFGSFASNNNNFLISSLQADKDLIFKGNDSDGGGTITALTLDMSNAGAATFNHLVAAGSNNGFYFIQADSKSSIRSESQSIVLQTYASSAWQDRLTVKNDGNVGIGTTSPAGILDVRNGTNQSVIIGNSGSYAGGEYGQLLFKESTTELAKVEWNGTGNEFEINNKISGPLTFYTSNDEKMRIDSSGNFLVAKTASDGANTGFEARATGQVMATIASSTNEAVVYITQSGAGGNHNSDQGLVITVEGTNPASGEGNILRCEGTNSSHGAINSVFKVTNGGNLYHNVTSWTTSSGGLRIEKSGNFSQLGFSRQSGDTGTQNVNVHYHNGSYIGGINTSTSATSFVTSSDYRLKENINYDWDATTRLKQLKPARFNWKIDETNTLVDGFLAHEVSSIVPEAIDGKKDEVNKDGNPKYQAIDQSKLVPLLVKTIQELEARIAKLEGV